MNPGSIRTFLLRHPKPHSIRVTTADDKVEDVPCKGRKFVTVAETVHALDPELIEVLDAKGGILRAVRTGGGPNAERANVLAETPHVLHDDAETARLTHFANLLKDAYHHSTEVAFVKMIELVERMGDRSDAIEQRLERAEAAHRRALLDQVDSEFERAEELAKGDGTSMREQMLFHFLNGQKTAEAESEAAAATNGKPNGKPNGRKPS